MNWLGWIILGEGLHLTTMTRSALLGIESHRTMARCRELTMRLKDGEEIEIRKGITLNLIISIIFSRV